MIRGSSDIQKIQEDYPWFYPLLMGAVLVVIGVAIGASLFGSDEPIVRGNMLGYFTNLWTEAVSIAITVFILDQINRRRDRLASEVKEREQKAEAQTLEKQYLIIQLRSKDNFTALNALEQIKSKGWDKDDTLKGLDLRNLNLLGAKLVAAKIQNANLRGSNLQGVNLMEASLQGSNLSAANLQEANLSRANLQRLSVDLTAGGINLKTAKLWEADLRWARLPHANLQKANLTSANLENADLMNADLQGAKLRYANLRHVNLTSAKLQNADMSDTNLENADLRKVAFNENTVLPDAQYISEEDRYDKFWTPETDMRRYSDSKHPDFWQPDWAKEQKE